MIVLIKGNFGIELFFIQLGKLLQDYPKEQNWQYLTLIYLVFKTFYKFNDTFGHKNITNAKIHSGKGCSTL